MAEPREVAFWESVVLAVLQALVTSLPEFADWLSRVIDGDEHAFTKRVREILPERSASRAVADALRRKEGGDE